MMVDRKRLSRGGQAGSALPGVRLRIPPKMESGAALVSHLAEHGVKASFATVKINGSSVGKVFEAYVKANGIDLLVMGAYRHSRLNEFVWGGATKTIIGRPPCWVMMSH